MSMSVFTDKAIQAAHNGSQQLAQTYAAIAQAKASERIAVALEELAGRHDITRKGSNYPPLSTQWED